MCQLTASRADTVPDPFSMVSNEILLSRDEIIQLYQSRYYMFVTFDNIELPPFHCSFRFEETIPKKVACSLYGPNKEVTLLQQNDGKLIVLDGCRCYPIWKEAVIKKELEEMVIMNVIREKSTLNDVQRLQLATFCNIQSRDTHMTSLSEKVFVSFAFYSSLTKERRGGRYPLSSIRSGTKPSICYTIAKGLFFTSLFDDQFPQPFRAQNTEYIEHFLRIIVRGCLQLSVEREMLEAITYYCREAPSCSEKYFHRQFFYDKSADWFRSAPLFKQILLIFVLPSFPYLNHYDEGEIDTGSSSQKSAEVRARLRDCIPRICEEVSCFLCSYVFEQENENDQGLTVNNLKRELDLPLIRNLVYEIQRAVYAAECDITNGPKDVIDMEMERRVIELAKKNIMQFSVSIAEKNLYLLFK